MDVYASLSILKNSFPCQRFLLSGGAEIRVSRGLPSYFALPWSCFLFFFFHSIFLSPRFCSCGLGVARFFSTHPPQTCGTTQALHTHTYVYTCVTCCCVVDSHSTTLSHSGLQPARVQEEIHTQRETGERRD